MDLKQHAKEQEERVREVLNMLHHAMLELDETHENGGCTSFHINYDEQDMFHAAVIFNSVCSNYAFKHGYLTRENCVNKLSLFREIVKETFGLNLIQETKVAELLKSIQNDSNSKDNQ